MFLTTKRAYFSRCCLFSFYFQINVKIPLTSHLIVLVEKIIFLDNFVLIVVSVIRSRDFMPMLIL